MHVLVMTVVHHPEDARILHRQVRALVDAGHEVTYAAPYTARGVVPRPWVTGVDLPRAAERKRLIDRFQAAASFNELRRFQALQRSTDHLTNRRGVIDDEYFRH